MSTIFLPAARQNQHTSEKDSFQLHASSAPLSVRSPPQRGRSLGCQTGQKTTQPGPQCCRVEFAERALRKLFLTSKLSLFGTKGTEGHFHAVLKCNFCCPMPETCNSSLKGHPEANALLQRADGVPQKL